jgi:hypothetical protein
MIPLLPTSYLPPLTYMAEMAFGGEVLIELNETYPKQTYRNRCEIYGANGMLPLSIPVFKPGGSHTKTKDIQISYHDRWQHVHWISLQSAYNTSPYFLYYRDYFEPFYFKKYKYLSDFNSELLDTITRLTGIKCDISYTEQYSKQWVDVKDMRNAFGKRGKMKPGILLSYYQVFSNKYGFLSNLSIVDLLFNEGKQSLNYLLSIYMNDNGAVE